MKKIYLFLTVVLTAIQLCAFEHNGVEYTVIGENSVKIANGTGVTGEVVIPETVTDPSDGKTYTVTEVGKQAFAYANISYLTLPNTVKSIGRVAFSYSTIQTIQLSETLEEIGYNAFSHCTELTSIEIPNSVKIVGTESPITGASGSAFFGCIKLKSVKLPDTLDKIDDITFKECESLESIEIPETVTYIGDQAFAGCKSLETIVLPESVQEIGESAFGACLSLTSVKLPSQLKKIKFSTFIECSSLTKIDIPEAVDEIGKQAFSACRSLTEVNVPNSVEHIATDAFYGCGEVEKVVLGTGVRRMGCASMAVWTINQMQRAEWKVKEIYCYSTVVPEYFHEVVLHELPEDFFFGTPDIDEEQQEEFYKTVTLYVPQEAIEEYKKSPQWNRFHNILAIGTSDIDAAKAEQAALEFDGTVVRTNHTCGIALYTTTGVRVAQTEASELNVEGLNAGIYIARSGHSTRKIVIR